MATVDIDRKVQVGLAGGLGVLVVVILGVVIWLMSKTFKPLKDGLGAVGGAAADVGHIAKDVTGTVRGAVKEGARGAKAIYKPKRVGDYIDIQDDQQPLVLELVSNQNVNKKATKKNTAVLRVKLPDGSPAINAKVVGTLKLKNAAIGAAVLPNETQIVTGSTNSDGEVTISWSVYNKVGDEDDDRLFVANKPGYNTSNKVLVK